MTQDKPRQGNPRGCLSKVSCVRSYAFQPEAEAEASPLTLHPEDQDADPLMMKDWQGNTHSHFRRALRTVAMTDHKLTDSQARQHAVLISVLLITDAAEAPAGYYWGVQGTSSQVHFTAKISRDSMAEDGEPGSEEPGSEEPTEAEEDHSWDPSYIGHLSFDEKMRFMSNLTWDTIKQWRGSKFEMHVNGTESIKNMASDYAAYGGAFGFGATDISSNSSGPISKRRSSEDTAPGGGNTTLPSSSSNNTQGSSSSSSSSSSSPFNASLNHPAHQNFDSKRHPTSILDVGTAYILDSVAGSSGGDNHSHSHEVRDVSSQGFTPVTPLHKQDGPVQCSRGSPCIDDSCCGSEGKCGYKKEHCGDGCTSNCDATAMCGIDSADGKTLCPLNLCCSYYGWCGTEEVHCYDPEPQFGVTPCQEGFGACSVYPSPSCGGRSAAGRRVGYYQGWNVRLRNCDKVPPSKINTKGLTHLFYSFVFFDPVTFQMTPMDPDDVNDYKAFTARATNTMQTWVAVGGWTFSDPGPYQMAWSDMVSTSANRAAFISSIISFMDEYGFTGADLDWEYPVDEDRGGRKDDADNLVLLVREMRAAFGSRYGLSLTLAPDFWYLRGFKPREMQPYVDFMGFMAYDLHGPWDTDVEALGKS